MHSQEDLPSTDTGSRGPAHRSEHTPASLPLAQALKRLLQLLQRHRERRLRVLEIPGLDDTQMFAVPRTESRGLADAVSPTGGVNSAAPGRSAAQERDFLNEPVQSSDRPAVIPGTGAFLRPSPAPPLVPRLRQRPASSGLRESLHARARRSAGALPASEFQQYELLEEIGTDTAESTFRARHRGSERNVVLVVREMTELAAARATVRIAGWALEGNGVSHPAIPRVAGWGSAGGVVYFAVHMEAASTLEQRLQLGPPLSYVQALRILRQVADALDRIHSAGKSHGDLRPACILLSGDAQSAGLIGAGLDAALRAGLPDEPWDSSPSYLAPECWGGNYCADARADQFALAVIAFEMLSNRRRAVHVEHEGMISVEPLDVPMYPLRPESSLAVNTALTRALSARPSVRFPSCGEFITALIGDALVERKQERRFWLWR